MTRHLSRTDHMDSALTGLALLEHYKAHDPDAFEAIVASLTPDETVFGLLHAMDILIGMFAAQLGGTPDQIVASMRTFMVGEMAHPTPEAPTT